MESKLSSFNKFKKVALKTNSMTDILSNTTNIQSGRTTENEFRKKIKEEKDIQSTNSQNLNNTTTLTAPKDNFLQLLNC